MKYSIFSESAADSVDVRGISNPTWKAPISDDRPITCGVDGVEATRTDYSVLATGVGTQWVLHAVIPAPLFHSPLPATSTR